MNQYMKTVIERYSQTASTITIKDDNGAINFEAEIGNPNYDAFLVQVDLTDEEVHALTPDVWYDFPALVEEEAPLEATVEALPLEVLPVEASAEETPAEEAPVEELPAAE